MPIAERDFKEWTISSVVAWMVDDLRKRGIESARLDAELIVAHALGIERVKVIVDGSRPLMPAELAQVRALFKRRRAFEPIAYVRGRREFFGHNFLVDNRVLIPRPDTETLVEHALARLRGRELYGRVLDLCTGSGCVGISIKLKFPTVSLDAVDVSADAIAVARANAHRLGAIWGVRMLVGDLFASLGPPRACYELIVANPPYIPAGDIAALQPDIRDHEPRVALDGGRDGLECIARIVTEAPRWLTEGGTLAMEIESGSAERVASIFRERGLEDVTTVRDYAGRDRVVSGTRAARA